MVLADSADNVAGLELLEPVLTVDPNYRLFELLLRFYERIQVLRINVNNLGGLCKKRWVFSTFKFLACAELCSFKTGRKGLLHSQVGFAALSQVLVVRKRSVLFFGVFKAISALTLLSFYFDRLLGRSRLIRAKVANSLNGSWAAMDVLDAFLTGRKLQVVLWGTSSFDLDDFIAPVLTSGSCGSRDASERGSIGVKSVLVILALSLLAPYWRLRVEATVHKVYVVVAGA